MTIYEHAMVGINGALALGLQRRHGWQIVALAGFAAVLPDFDGLTILLGPQCYAAAHRLWAHNLLVAGSAAAIVSAVAYYSGVLTHIRLWLTKRLNLPEATSQPRPQRSVAALGLWIVVGVIAAYSHLLMDVAFSAGRDLPIWGDPLSWPFSDKAYAYPLVRWGDIGATLIFAASMFAMLRWPARLQTIAAASLLAVAGYMAARGFAG